MESTILFCRIRHYEAAMKEYNKEENDEYDTLHFADNIVVDDKNLPNVFTPLTDWRDLKRVYKEVTASLDKTRQDSMLSGRNDSDSEESTNSHTVKIPTTTKKYIIYWNLFANQDPQRFHKMNRELPDVVYFESGRSKKKTGIATGKKKKTKKDIHQEMMIAAMDRGTNVDQDRLNAELARSRFIQYAFQVDSLTKLNSKRRS
jgi:hypothetical protein